MSSRGTPAGDGDRSRLLDVVQGLVEELGGPGGAVRLEADLERELGLGSLERVELLTRIERAFGVSLPDAVVTDAHTPKALLDALGEAPRRESGEGPPARARVDAPGSTAGPAAGAPSSAPWGPPPDPGTLVEVARHRAEVAPDEVHLRLFDPEAEAEAETEGESYRPLTHGELWRRSLAVAAGLRAEGSFEGGDRVCLLLPTSLDFFPAFQGILAADGTAVPIYPPARLDRLESYLERHGRLLENAGARVVLTDRLLEPVARLLAARVRSRGAPRPRVVVVSELTLDLPADPAAGRGPDAGAALSAAAAQAVAVEPDRLALLQYTSGSTGDPKGVALTHAHLLANMTAIGEAMALGPEDVCVSWLPLYHDMGLIGSWLTAQLHGVPLVILSPLHFLARPERWLEAIHRFRGTIGPAPNFGYEMCLKKVPEGSLPGLDLSSWRYAMNGSEPIRAGTLERFTERFAPHGFRREAFHPAYGLAENSVAVALSPVGRGPRIDRVDRDLLLTEGRAVPLEGDPPGDRAPAALELISCGPPIPGVRVRVVDDGGEPLAERIEGRILFRSPSTMAGYFGRPEATAAIRTADGFIDSGDLGYLADGEIHVTGRVKDLVIKGGRNYHPQDIEAAAASVEGIREGCVAAFAVDGEALGGRRAQDHDPAGTGQRDLSEVGSAERLVVVAETRLDLEDEESSRRLAAEVSAAVADRVGIPADRVELVAPGTLPKTSSGKLRRRETRQRFLDGALAAGAAGRGRSRALWGARGRLALAVIGGRAGRAFRGLGRLPGRLPGRLLGGALGVIERLYGLWVLGVALQLLVPAGVLVLLVPGRGERARRRAWHLAGGALRLVAAVTGLGPVRRQRLPEGSLVVVSNHASYLDALVLLAALDRPVVFTAKREVLGWPLVGAVARRLGVVPVDRSSAGQRLDAFEAARQAVRSGRQPALHVFPESTFTGDRGLRPFRLGAFRLAADERLAVVPVAVLGTRRVLPAGRLLVRPGRLGVRVLPALAPPSEEASFRALTELRGDARRQLAGAVEEPLLDIVSAALPGRGEP